MTPGARYGAVIYLYNLITSEAKPADQLMQSFFRQRKFIGSKDRRFIADLLYTMLRHYGRLHWWAKRLGLELNGRNLMLLWLGLGEGQELSGIAALFDGAGYAPDSLSRFERGTLEKTTGENFMPPDIPEAIRAECPDWAYAGLKKRFGDAFLTEMMALQEEAPLDLRVNILKAERDSVLKRLRIDEMDAKPTPYSPLGIRITGRPNFSAHPLYEKGAFEVQDEGSQILSLLCDVKPGEWVVDFCAGAGGKTLALAAQMQNKGRIWACDVEENRLENSRKRLRRAGVHCVQTQVLDDEDDDWVRKHAGKADCVLIDAPCTGVGTWRRNPFARWQNLGPSLNSLMVLQARILDSAARLVKPGGRLVYATCSMLPAENEDQVSAFLVRQAQFCPQELTLMGERFAGALKVPDLAQSSLQMTPAQHETDGFFIAMMKRI